MISQLVELICVRNGIYSAKGVCFLILSILYYYGNTVAEDFSSIAGNLFSLLV